MADFTLTYPTMYCTPMDVRILSNLLSNMKVSLPSEEQENVVISDQEVVKHIRDATAIVKAYLLKKYGSALETATPYFSPALAYRDNARLQTDWWLEGLTVSAAANTEQWTITFTTETAFSIRGSISGSQGTGSTDADFTSTNSHVVIESGFWNLDDGVPSPGDRLVFSTYKHYESVVTITAKIACAHVLSALLSEVSPAESRAADRLEKEGMDLLKMLADSKSDVTLTGGEEISDLYILHRYNITLLGEDTTEYETESGDGASIVDDWDDNYS